MLKALCGLLCLGVSFVSVAEPSPEQLKEFDKFFQEQVQQQQVPGAGYAIVYKNKIIRAKF